MAMSVVGTITERAGVPIDVGPWGWTIGFYPSMEPPYFDGTAINFEQARADFEECWQRILPTLTEAQFDAWRRDRDFTPRSGPGAPAARSSIPRSSVRWCDVSAASCSTATSRRRVTSTGGISTQPKPRGTWPIDEHALPALQPRRRPWDTAAAVHARRREETPLRRACNTWTASAF